MKKLLAALVLCSAAFAQQPVTGSGAAGTAASGVVTVQGIASMTPILTTTTVNTWAAGTLGAMANYGTSPGAVLVPGVNAYVTNAISTTPPTPSTSSSFAFTIKHSSSAAAANVKASAGNLYGLAISNGGAIPCWVQLFNSAGTPTAGTSVIDSYMVQAGLTVVIPPGQLALENFGTGIAFAGATADGGATTTGCTTTISTTFYYN